MNLEIMYVHENCVRTKNCARTQKNMYVRKKMCTYAKKCARTRKIVHARKKLCMYAKKYLGKNLVRKGGFWLGNYASH